MPRYVWDDESRRMVKVSEKVPARGVYDVQEATLRDQVLAGYKKVANRPGGYRGGWKPESIKRAWGT